MTFKHTNGTARRAIKPLTGAELIARYDATLKQAAASWDFTKAILEDVYKMRGEKAPWMRG